MRHTRGLRYIGQRTSVYPDDDLHAAVKASGVPLAELIRRGLAASAAEIAAPVMSTLATSPPLATLPDGEPSHGAICMAPGCWERNTARYGLRQLPLCPACAAALRGEVYQRELPPGAARLLRRGAA